MKNKTQTRLIILSAVLILCLTVYVLKDNFSQLFPSSPLLVFSSVQPSQISELSVIDSATQSAVYKKNNQWYTKKGDMEFKADSSRIENLIKTLTELSKDDVVSSNKNNRKNFGLDTQRVEFQTQTRKHTVFIGKQSGSKNYVAVDSDQNVFTSEGLNSVFVPNDYRDMVVGLITDEASVTSIIRFYNSEELKLTKKNNEWLLNDQKAKKDAVDFYINDLKTIKADDLLKQDVSGLYSTMKIQIGENGKEKTAEFYERDNDYYWISISGDPYLYQVPSSFVKALQKSSGEFAATQSF